MDNNSYVFQQKLIMVMGMQRSGTTALLEALGQDPNLRVENERVDGPIYDDHYLRPERELRPLFWRVKPRILLKPIKEVQRRSVEDVLREFSDYGVKVAWIYRDPVNVWSSAITKWSQDAGEVDAWIELWNRGNLYCLEALEGRYRDQIAVVRYEDLIAYRETFSELCAFLGVQERNNVFWQRDLKKGRSKLPAELQQVIEEGTNKTLMRLHAKRLWKPRTGSSDTRLGDISGVGWTLHQHGAQGASLDFVAECPGLMRIELPGLGNSSPHAVQLDRTPLALAAGQRYSFSFWARANQRRQVGLVFGQNYEPWSDLGQYHLVTLGPNWNSFHFEFIAEHDENNARVLFDLGGSDAAVEISAPYFALGSCQMQLLELHNGAEARLAYDPAVPGSTRIEIQSLPRPDSRTDVQLTQAKLPLEEGVEYTVYFRARADRPRPLAVAVGEANSPWHVAGLYRTFMADSQWRTSRLDFAASKTTLGRLYFDLGDDSNTIEIADAELTLRRPGLNQLHLHEGARAELQYPTGDTRHVRVVIHEAPTGVANHLQLCGNFAAVEAGERYSVSFRARADRPRKMEALASQSNHPWDGIGFFAEVALAPEWRVFHFSFVAEASDPAARIHFDLGNSTVPVEIAAAELKPGLADLSDKEIARMRRILDCLDRPAPIAANAR